MSRRTNQSLLDHTPDAATSRRFHIWRPTGSYYTCAECGQPYRGREDGCTGEASEDGIGCAIVSACIVVGLYLIGELG